MSPLDRIEAYLAGLHRRLTLAAIARGVALTAAVAAAATIAIAVVMNALAFSDPSVTAGRVALSVALGLVIALALVVPALKLTRWRAARRAEASAPGLEQRLLTIAEQFGDREFNSRRSGIMLPVPESRSPFLDLLAAETIELAPPASEVVPPRRIAGLLAAAGIAAAAVVWLVLAAPGWLGHGAALLWAAPRTAEPYYQILVSPGDRTVRRNTDQLVTARLNGFETPAARLYAHYQGAKRWEQAAMQPRAQGGGFEFLFAGLPDSVDYYVEAAGIRSKTYRFSVKDLPAVKRIRVTYRYPKWTGLAPETEDPGGDLRAVEGTEAEVAVETDRPLENGALVLDNGEQLPLAAGRARVPIRRDGAYHIAALDAGQAVRLSDDYFIEARRDSPPTVRIERPGRDARVSPIEEVTVEASAQDDFGVRALELHYSVNGGPEQTIPIRGGRGAATLYLEDFKLVPGDVVALYALARDARTAARTDMYFLQAEPFERNYSQSQQAGGDQGGGPQDQQISERQKEIIAATWNQLRGTAGSGSPGENARFLSEVQGKLRDQAKSLARRMASRELSVENDEFRTFATEMDQAAAAMTGAEGKLKAQQWQPALAPEQQALQHLLRAEAVFRDIQVAFRRGGGGRGGQGGGAGRDLESLFDLELDTEKNQYETGRQGGGAGERDKAIEDAFEKLKELARRQQQMAEQRNRQQIAQQRWQQELLRREAEELRRKLEEMTRSQSGQSGQSASSSQQAGQGGREGSLEEALRQLSRATDDMRRASSQPNGEDARRAAERLAEAQRALEQSQRQQSATQLDDLARQAERLSAEQQNYVSRLQQQFADAERMPSLARGDGRELAKEREKMLSDLQRLESDMQQQARNLASTAPQAASKLRDALGGLQQDDVRSRVRLNAELLRRGYGAYTIMREAPITRSLEQLKDDLRDAQAALGRQPQPGPGSREAQQAERALAEIERLRQELADHRAGGRDTGAYGRRLEGGSPEGWTWGIMRLQRALQNFPELARKIEGASGRDLPGRLDQVELELRRKLGDSSGSEARSNASEPVPAGYADAVAEYFKKLSKP